MPPAHPAPAPLSTLWPPSTADRCSPASPAFIDQPEEPQCPAHNRARLILVARRLNAAPSTPLVAATLITAMTLELHDDAADLRQQAAIEALRGLAEGLKAEAVPPAIPDTAA